MALAKDRDVRNQRRIGAKATEFQARCNARANAAHADSTPTQYIERWTDLSKWVMSDTPLQVSNGKAYSTATGGALSGAAYPISLAANETMRAVVQVNQVAGGGSGTIVVGVGKDAPGAFPASGLTNCFGIGLGASSSAQHLRYNGGSTEQLGVLATTGPWTFTITVDLNYASVVARSADGLTEYRGRWARSTIGSINNITIFCSDARALTGQSFGPIGIRRAVATMTPRAGVEGVLPSVQWSQLGTSGYRIALPTSYDSRVPNPAVLMFHGSASDETHWGDNGNGRGVANAFLDAGYVVIGASHTTNRITFGAQMSLDAYVTAFMEAAKLYNLGSVVFYGNSMGGIESLLSLAEGRIPGVVAWIGSVPTASLDAMWNLTPGYLDRIEHIRTAYGIAADGSDYAAKTAGHDPMMLDPRLFGGVPMYAVVATDDEALDQSRHWDVFAPRVAPYATEMKRLNITGGHSTNQIAANAASMVEFAKKYAPI